MALMQQFARPHGLFGRLVGSFMPVLNAGQITHVVDDLAPAAGERVLEIGFGPGVGLAQLARRRPDLQVAGVDPSPTMVNAAQRRVRRYGERVRPAEGSASALDWPDAHFDAVCATNSAQLWHPIAESLAEVLRVLRPGGRAVLGVHERAVLPGGGHAGPTFDQTLVPALVAAGFVDVVATWRPSKGGRALVAHARRPGEPEPRPTRS